MLRTIVRRTAGAAVTKLAQNGKKLIFNTPRLLLALNIPVLTKEVMQDIDLNLQEACSSGDCAILEVMDAIKDQIEYVCSAYKSCLKKQLEIMKETSLAGSLTDRWDDLPEYRTKALELSQELNNFIVVLNTIAAMAKTNSMKYITEHKDQLDLLTKKINEIETMLEAHSKEIDALQTKILNIKREIILKLA